ncbi:MAG: cation diffusion facilitator family transporter [Bacteroides sp.]|nr:cation diffusion facilitator family transporter [Bacteroides sp.]
MDEITSSSAEKERARGIYKVTVVGSLVNFLLIIVKFLAGIYGRSAAMIADAVHSLSDFITDLIVLVFIRFSSKPVDHSHDYGHGKFETLATAMIGIILLFVGLGVLWSGTSTVWGVLHGEVLQAPGYIALIAAMISIVSKEILYHYTVVKGKTLHSPALIANGWHHRSDAFSSIATLVGIGGAILLGENWRILDPVAAILVSFLIMKVAIQLLIPCVDELLEKSLPEETEQEIEEIVLSFPGVSHPHDLRTRRIGNNYAIELHIRMDGNVLLTKAHQISTDIEEKLRERFGPGTHIAIHPEPKKRDLSRNL